MDGIGARIRKRRLKLKMTQAVLASALGVACSSITKIEKEQRRLPIKYLNKVAQALKTTPDYIMGWDKGENAVMDKQEIRNEKANIQTMSEVEFYRKADKGARVTVSDLEETTKGANQCREAIIALAGGADYAIEALITEYGNLIADAKIYTQELAQAGYSEDEIHALRRGYYLDKIGGAE